MRIMNVEYVENSGVKATASAGAAATVVHQQRHLLT